MAEQIGASNPKPRDAKTVARARSAVILAFGRALSGAPAAITKALLGTPGIAPAGGRSLVFGTERRTSAVDAALTNATAAAAGSDMSIDAGNAASIVSLFGLCEERQTTGQAFLDALMFGAEMSASLAPAAGKFGSALLGNVVAATRVLQLSPPRIAAALLMAGIANPDGARNGQGGLSALAIGLSLKNGLLAALLAETMDEASCAAMAGTGNGAAMGAAADLLAVQTPPGADLWEQFERQASAVLPRDHIAPLFERLETIDKVTDLATVSRLLQGRGTQAAPKKVVFAPRGTHEPEETNWVP
jgi:2-methylcitrate dehydratase PrpD